MKSKTGRVRVCLGLERGLVTLQTSSCHESYDHERYDPGNADRASDSAEGFAEEVGPERHDCGPGHPAQDVEDKKAAPGHPVHAREDTSERGDHRHEPNEEDNLPAVPSEQVLTQPDACGAESHQAAVPLEKLCAAPVSDPKPDGATARRAG